MAEGIFFHSTPQAGTALDAHGSWYQAVYAAYMHFCCLHSFGKKVLLHLLVLISKVRNKWVGFRLCMALSVWVIELWPGRVDQEDPPPHLLLVLRE